LAIGSIREPADERMKRGRNLLLPYGLGRLLSVGIVWMMMRR